MLGKTSILLGISFLAFGNGLTYNIDPVSLSLVRDTIVNCSVATEGRYCKNCNDISECIYLGDGIWLNEPVGTCEGETKCMAGTCTAASNPVCDPGVTDYVHKCKQAGLFPHPFNQCEYFLCAPPPVGSSDEVEAVKITCASGYLFDSTTSMCSIKKTGMTCPTLITPCTSLGDRGQIPNNPHLYFMCVSPSAGKVIPQIYQCAGSSVFNATKRACSEPLPKDTGLKVDGRCTRNGLFYDPTSCFYYMDCYAENYFPTRRSCYPRMFFNDKLGRCVDFGCGNTGL